MTTNSPGVACAMAMKVQAKIIEDFKSFAQDNSRDCIQFPVTMHLQDYIKKKVLTASSLEGKRVQFIDFAGKLCEAFEAEVSRPPSDVFEAIEKSLPGETPADKRVQHAVDKVALHLGLRLTR